MGSKPKKQDFKPSAAEQASAAVAKAEYDYFKQNYEPLLIEMRDKAKNEDFRSSIRGRAAADVAQALTSDLSLQRATNVSLLGDTAGAYSGQLQKADEAALGVKNTLSTGVLGTARKQAAEAQTGMAQASRLATSDLLNKAKTNQQVAQAKFDAGVSLAGATIMGAADKYARDRGEEGRFGFAGAKGYGTVPRQQIDDNTSGFGVLSNTFLDKYAIKQLHPDRHTWGNNE